MKQMIVKNKCRFVLITSIILISGLAFANLNNKVPTKAHKRNKIAVTVGYLKKTTVAPHYTTLGNLQALHRVALSFDVSGKIKSINYFLGEKVTAGTTLLQLEAANQQATLLADQASLALKRIKLKRYLPLLKTGMVSLQDIDAVKADYLQAKAKVAGDQASLAKTSLIAPFTGVISGPVINIGHYVKSGTVLLNLVDTEHLYIAYHLPASYLSAIALGQSVTIQSSILPEKQFAGTINYISPQIDQASQTITVQAKVNNTKQFLAPGMAVSVSQRVGAYKVAYQVPVSALLLQGQQYYIYLIHQGRAKLHAVKMIKQINNQAYITGEFTNHQPYIINPTTNIHDGSAVTIENHNENK